MNDILAKYENLSVMRKDTQVLFFEILKEIDEYGLTSIDVCAEELGRNREADLNHITQELNIIQEYKTGFDEALSLIYDGTIEQLLIQDENSW